jgi:hypothetical protein
MDHVNIPAHNLPILMVITQIQASVTVIKITISPIINANSTVAKSKIVTEMEMIMNVNASKAIAGIRKLITAQGRVAQS